MAPRCAVCAHSDHLAIDAALVSGSSIRAVATAHGLDRNAVHRHAQNHLSADLAAGAAAHAVATVAPAASVADGPARALDLGVPLAPSTPPATATPIAATTPPIGAASSPLNPYAIACELRDQVLSILRAALARGDARTALEAIRASVPLLDRLDRLMPRAGADAAPAALANSSEWATLRAALLGALGPYPDARAAVVAVLTGGV